MKNSQDLEKFSKQSFIRKSFELKFLVFFLLWVFLEVLQFYDLVPVLGINIEKLDLELWLLRILFFIEIILFIPYYAFLKSFPEKEDFLNFLTVTLDIIVYTFIAHYLGGIQLLVLIFGYIFIIVSSVGIFPRKTIYLIVVMCSASYIILFSLEYFMLIPSKVVPHGELTAAHYFLRLVAVIFLLGCGGYISGQIADIIAERKSLINLDTFFSGLSHELVNPLAVIKNEVTLLKREFKNQHLTTIDKQTEQIAAFVDDVLSYSGEKKPVLQSIDLIGIVDTASSYILKGMPEDKTGNIEVVKNYLEDNIEIQGDSFQLQQGFINIIRNAIEAMNYQGILCIKVSIFNVFWALVSISERGNGMSKEDLTNIFDPFYFKKRKYIGTGLELAIAKRIIEDHGGNIEVESKAGKGITFLVKLPIS